jgi:spermidine synthase
VGTHRTFLLFALALAVVAVPQLGRRRALAAVVPAATALLLVLPTGTVKDAGAGKKVIWERETEYQYARVVEDRTGTRTLELNEGHAVHSEYRPGRWLTGNYWDEMLALTAATGRLPQSVAILGNAAGTTARAIGHYFPDARVDAVEIDPDVSEVGRKLFDMTGPDLHVHTADARTWLRASTRTFDVILVDAYRQPYIPFYLATKEFFADVRDHLAPGGVAVINVGHPEDSHKLEKVLAATMRTSFSGAGAGVWQDPAEDTNTQLVGTTAGDPAADLRTLAPDLPADLAAVVRDTASRLSPAPTGGTVYTDDRAPVEWLVDLSLAGEAG